MDAILQKISRPVRELLSVGDEGKSVEGIAMPMTMNSASWDFSPSDPVNLTAAFSFDTQDTQDSAPVAAALAAIQGRLIHATVTVSQTDPATIAVALTI
jgi:hypothetical protein